MQFLTLSLGFFPFHVRHNFGMKLPIKATGDMHKTHKPTVSIACHSDLEDIELSRTPAFASD